MTESAASTYHKSSQEIGRILCSSTVGFIAGCQATQPHIPPFGAFVKVSVNPDIEVLGLVYNISVTDDALARQLVSASKISDILLRDHRENRQAPIEVSALAVGFCSAAQVYQYLPPLPPPALGELHPCTDQEIIAFTEKLDYFCTVLNTSGQIPADELLAASLRQASLCRGHGKPDREFLIRAGRELARLLGDDPMRLDGLLRRIRA